MYLSRVDGTEKVKDLLDKIREDHGDIILYMSGGCCDGTVPICFTKDEFKVGENDIKVGSIFGCDFFMAKDQFEYHKNSHITIDVLEGRASGFSLETMYDCKFVANFRIFSEEELEKLNS